MFGVPGSQPFQEFYEARERSVAGHMWYVYEEYTILDGVIAPVEGAKKRDPYIPAGRPELPGEFAKLAGENQETILAFVKRYGLLGYGRAYSNLLELMGAKQLGVWSSLNQGDPIDWILMHATSVDIVMSLSEALDKPRELEDLIRLFKSKNDKGQQIVSYRYVARGIPLPGLSELLILNNEDEVRRHNDPFDSSYKLGIKAVLNDPRDISLTMIADILNENLSGIPRYLQLEGKPDTKRFELKSLFRTNNLLDSIYWMLADAVVSGRIRSCKECGNNFVVGNDKRVFCYPVMGDKSEGGRCLNRNKKRRQRSRER